MAEDRRPPLPRLTYLLIGGLTGTFAVGGLWLEVSDTAANPGPGYIVATLDDERYPPEKDD